MRLLDPQLALSYPSAILCRDKALVVNLEHIKCIITMDHVLVLNADEENVITFIEELQRRMMPAASQIESMQKSRSMSDLKSADSIPEDLGGSGSRSSEETPFELRALEVALDVVSTEEVIQAHCGMKVM